MTHAIGIDIGGTGIKGAVVDVETGDLISERAKVATPEGGRPDDIVAAVVQMIDGFGPTADGLPVGVCFPAVVIGGTTMSAANVSKKWIGLEAEKLFEKALGRDIFFINDADAAGIAEVRFGAAKGRRGLVILTTLGTGIGSAFLYNGTRRLYATSYERFDEVDAWMDRVRAFWTPKLDALELEIRRGPSRKEAP